ncbi:MAG TPA: ATP-dependent Clp protease ATP-binding subunit ClpA [Lachnospiraceae bacterium]|nr:ATP-dependent Clp protease ATP-binding subunit ClpA [Lachnospiraceae bacterium]
MNLSRELSEILRDSIEYSSAHKYELVTPEILILIMCGYNSFRQAFIQCGGDVEQLKADLTKYGEEYIGRSTTGNPELSYGIGITLEGAARQAISGGKREIGIRHIVNALWDLPDSYAVYYMKKQKVDKTDLLRALTEVSDDRDNEVKTGEAGEKWQAYAPCLNDLAESANPLIGREDELERTIQVLCRRDKNNPLHIGEPGVGKTAITYGLAQRINEDRVPDPIKGSRIFMLDLGGMLAGTQYRGDFEKRFKMVLEAIGKEEKPIVYIDEIHNLSGAGAAGDSSHDAANMLKPYLSGGKIRFIGATTFDEYKKHFEKNKSLARRFQNIEIKEPTQDEAVGILKGLKEKYENFHGVIYGDDVLEYTVGMSAKYINERFLPDKAIDLMDEAGAYRKLHPVEGYIQRVDKDVVAGVLTKICRIPVESVESEKNDNLATLEERLKGQIFGQDDAVMQVVNAIKFSRAGLIEDGKPLASLLFVGPTGVGKTEVARCLANELGVKLIRFDMSEYGEKHAVAKLIGSPAGYVGYEEGGLLTEEIRKNPNSVLLLDEIEKANPDIYSILLQVMDYATLTDNQGRKADFRNVVLIMTSNAGANRIGKKGIGFGSDYQDDSALMEEVKRTFQPEFRNRLNKIVSFNGMDDKMAARIVDKKTGELRELLNDKNISLEVDEKAKELILKRGISHEFGAREVDRVIRNDIKPLFVDEILFGDLKDGGSIRLTAQDDDFYAVI